ncbi:hypothetical protein TNCV_192511 [Trichonephila clavipes]|nr:hypothetical protein TNCV_192511 [Trichonephila clavipes]
MYPIGTQMYTAGHRKCNTKKDKRQHNKIYFVYNMLTKYQMIKFIDFCEVWSLQESVTRLLEIIAVTRLGFDSKRLWMCSWGTADQAASTRCQN